MGGSRIVLGWSYDGALTRFKFSAEFLCRCHQVHSIDQNITLCSKLIINCLIYFFLRLGAGWPDCSRRMKKSDEASSWLKRSAISKILGCILFAFLVSHVPFDVTVGARAVILKEIPHFDGILSVHPRAVEEVIEVSITGYIWCSSQIRIHLSLSVSGRMARNIRNQFLLSTISM